MTNATKNPHQMNSLDGGTKDKMQTRLGDVIRVLLSLGQIQSLIVNEGLIMIDFQCSPFKYAKDENYVYAKKITCSRINDDSR